MANIAIDPITVHDFHYVGTTFTLRIFSDKSWVALDGSDVPGMGDGETFYREYAISVVGTDATIPAVTLASQTDAPSEKNALYVAYFFVDGVKKDMFLANTLGAFQVPDTPTTTTWKDLEQYNFGTNHRYFKDERTYSALVIDQKIAAIAGTGAVNATTTQKGIGKVSVAPVTPTSPIFVGDNDPRVTLINALAYGVLNDGTAQSTANLQLALDAAASQVSSISGQVEVFCPPGNYLFSSGSLTIAQGVSLTGSWPSTFGHTWIFDGASQPSALDGRGTTFEVTAGSGSSSGAFITGYANTCVRGISFYYPSQSRTAATPTQYPATIFLGQDSSHTHFDQSVIDCEFIGAWQAIKARYGGRYLLRNIKGYPVNGIDIDKSYDVSRFENIEFNAFWYSSNTSTPPADNYFKYVNQNGVAIKVGRVDELIITNPYLLGYFKGIETVTTSAEGSLPGGSAWMLVQGGGAEACYHGAYLASGQEVGGIQFDGFDCIDTYDASGGGLGDGLVTTSTFDTALQVNGGIFGSASNTQNYNLVLSGGGQVNICGARFHNASVHNALINSLVGNPANANFKSCIFNTSTLQSINVTGYAKLTSEANTFIQKNRADAIITAGLGGFVAVSNGDRFLDFAVGLGPVGVNGTFILETGEVSFPKNVQFINGVNSFGVANIQGIPNGATQGWGTFAINATYNRDTAEWSRGDITAEAWLIIAESNTSSNGPLLIRHAAAGANPITWTTVQTISAAGLTTFLTALVSTSLTMADAANIILNTATGSQIGTAVGQKLAFHGSTPVVQRSGAAQAAVVTTAATQTTPWGFATQAQADGIITLLNEMRAALVEKGIIKGAA